MERIAFIAAGVLIFGWLLQMFLGYMIKRGAKKIHDQAKKAVSTPPAYREVRVKNFPDARKEFPNLDYDFYDSMESQLRQRGFSYHGDWEDTSITAQHPNMKTFIRVLLSADGTIAAGIYDVKPKGWLRLLQKVNLIEKDMRTLDLETEFTNGAFLGTHTIHPKSLLRETPGITRVLRPRGTSASALLEVHERILADWKQNHPEFVPVVLRSAAEAQAMQHRMQQLKQKHREATGYFTREDMNRISRGNLELTGSELMNEIERIHPPRV